MTEAAGLMRVFTANGERNHTLAARATLEGVQKEVGGYIELIASGRMPDTNEQFQVFVNEDGHPKGLPHNTPANIWLQEKLGKRFSRPIVGNMVVLLGSGVVLK